MNVRATAREFNLPVQDDVQTSEMLTLRDLVSPIIRYRWVALLTFFILFGIVTTGVMLMKPEYEATMKVLVRRERMDPLMTPAANPPAQAGVDVTEDELNLEVELLKSRDLLEQVVLSSGLVTTNPSADRTDPDAREEISRGVLALGRNLRVAAMRKTTMI